MPLPEFNSTGDLPEGVHKASLDEVLARFGQGTPQRQLVTTKLLRLLEMAKRTGKLERFVIFGSYVTAKPAPNDVDVILVMGDDFRMIEYEEKTQQMFDHLTSQSEFGASFFGPIGQEFFLKHWTSSLLISKSNVIRVNNC